MHQIHDVNMQLTLMHFELQYFFLILINYVRRQQF